MVCVLTIRIMLSVKCIDSILNTSVFIVTRAICWWLLLCLGKPMNTEVSGVLAIFRPE